MNAFRACSLLSAANTCRLIRKGFTSNSSGVKRHSRRLLRNYIIPSTVLLGGGSLYYFYYLTPKQRRQITVVFEGLRRAFRLVINRLVFIRLLSLYSYFISTDHFKSVLLLQLIINIYFGQYQIHHQNMKQNLENVISEQHRE